MGGYYPLAFIFFFFFSFRFFSLLLILDSFTVTLYRGNLFLRPPVPFCSQEMAAVSAFMTSQRPYPTHYMETAIKTYLNACRYVLNVPLCDAILSAISQPLGSVLFHVFKLMRLFHDQNNFVTTSSQPSFSSCWFLRHNRVIFFLEISFWKWRGIVSPAFLVFYLTIIPRARMGYELSLIHIWRCRRS